MTLGAAVDVGIGLMFVFLLLSLVATATREAWVAAMGTRHAELEAGLRQMLTGSKDAVPDGARIAGAPTTVAELFQGVWRHGLITNGGTVAPSYLPARNVAAALLDVVTRGKDAPQMQDIETGIKGLPDGPVKEALTAMLKDAQGNIATLKKNLENWFDDAMARLSGVFKRWTQVFTLVLGLVIAVALNVDTIQIADTLWKNHDARVALADLAQKSLDQVKPGSTDAQTMADAAQKLLNQLPLPMGWNAKPGQESLSIPELMCATVRQNGFFGFLRMLLGWIITALAMSLGAPFWFDLLQKVVNIRSTGPKPPAAADTARAAT